MLNLFKKILPALRARFFGPPIPTAPNAVISVVYCIDLYIVDENLDTLYITDYVDDLYIVDSNERELYINDYESDLFITDQLEWEINDGCR